MHDLGIGLTWTLGIGSDHPTTRGIENSDLSAGKGNVKPNPLKILRENLEVWGLQLNKDYLLIQGQSKKAVVKLLFNRSIASLLLWRSI